MGVMVFGGVLGGIFGRRISKRLDNKGIDRIFFVLLIVIALISVYNLIKYISVSYTHLARIVWMPKDLKEQVAERLNATAKELYGIDNFTDMIGDETIAEDPETLLEFLTEK